MKIAIIGNIYFDNLEWHLKYTLEKMGHSVSLFNEANIIYSKIISKNIFFQLRKKSTKFENNVYFKLARTVIDYEPDLVIVCYKHIPARVIDFLKRTLVKSKVIHLNPDSMITMSEERQYILDSPYDAWFTKDHYQEDFMKNKLGLNVFYLPEAFNPDLHKPPGDFKNLKEDYDIAIVANTYPYKNIIQERIYNELHPKMIIRGAMPWWLRSDLRNITHKQIFGGEKAYTFYSAKICLNIFHYSEVNSVNCRFFEIIGSGGCQVCDDKPAVYEFLEKDTEIVTFKNYDELKDKLKYYLEHFEERLNIRQKSFEKFKDKHTYQKRLEFIFKVL
jgi:spore maturation protein CgeB